MILKVIDTDKVIMQVKQISLLMVMVEDLFPVLLLLNRQRRKSICETNMVFKAVKIVIPFSWNI